LLGSKLDPPVMGWISFLRLDDDVPRLVMLFVEIVNSEVDANIGYLF
jgi:hypothetical protein